MHAYAVFLNSSSIVRAHIEALREAPRKIAVRCALWLLEQPEVRDCIKDMADDSAAYAMRNVEEQIDDAIDHALHNYSVDADDVNGLEDSINAYMDNSDEFANRRETERTLERMQEELDELDELKRSTEAFLDDEIARIRTELGAMVRDAAIAAIAAKLQA